jgi:hypothetical protein
MGKHDATGKRLMQLAVGSLFIDWGPSVDINFGPGAGKANMSHFPCVPVIRKPAVQQAQAVLRRFVSPDDFRVVMVREGSRRPWRRDGRAIMNEFDLGDGIGSVVGPSAASTVKWLSPFQIPRSEAIVRVTTSGTKRRDMADIERISAEEAHRKAKANQALLVCAYEDEAKCRMVNLDGSISLTSFEARVASLPKTQEIIFYCA